MVLVKYMATLFYTLFCVCVLVNLTYGAQAIRKPVSKPAECADQEGCYDPDLNKVLPYNVPFFSHDCMRYTCNNNGEIFIVSCGAINVANPALLLKGDKSLPYPDCCDSIDMSQKPNNP